MVEKKEETEREEAGKADLFGEMPPNRNEAVKYTARASARISHGAHSLEKG